MNNMTFYAFLASSSLGELDFLVLLSLIRYWETWLTLYRLNMFKLFFLILFPDCCKCTDVRHPLHLQRTVGLFSVLVDFLHYGCAVLWRQVLQVSG